MKQKNISKRFEEFFDEQCEFWQICELYDKSSVTCTKDKGGTHCGQWNTLVERREMRTRKR